MLKLYERAKSEANYNARIFIRMVVDKGGLKTAQYLLHTPKVSEGYTALWELGCLELTVEAVIILDRKWWPLFTPDQLRTAVNRLREHEYTGELPDFSSV